MSPTTKAPTLDNGTVLNGKWEILQHLATGGKGEVYRARQSNLNREVVVKTISVDYLEEFGDDPEEVRTEIQRFHREALAMARIRHPYVAQVYDQDAAAIVKNGEEVTVQYVVMEYVPGDRTLRDSMPLDGYRDNERELRHWIRTFFLPMFDGLETVHALGIVHRDMKPENVLLDCSTPKIIDFGIAGGPLWSQLTRSHHVEGTITYMAPEQFMDLGETDGRADVYALGKMLYEVVQGKMVDSKTACPLKGVCLSNPSTPFLKDLDLIVREATAEDKENRIQSVAAFRDALERVLDKADAAERPFLRGLSRKQWVAIAGVLVVIVVASNLYHHFIMSHEVPVPPRTSAPAASQPGAMEQASVPEAMGREQDAPPRTLAGEDDSIMRLVQGGLVKLPSHFGAEGGKLIDVPQFYMDETEVTNYKYVEFLNQALSRVQVKDGVVLGDGRPWLILGPVYGGYEPIVFPRGRFSLQDASAASRPAVRVTGYGAEAYASHYGKRLPAEMEWLLAARRREDSPEKHPAERPIPSAGTGKLQEEMEAWVGAFRKEGGDAPPRQGRSTLPEEQGSRDSFKDKGASTVPYPVLDFAPNEDGIRGLTGNVSEWGVRLPASPNAKPQFVVLGGVRGTMLAGSTPFPGIAQDPSMAFEDVGFRCAKSVEESHAK